MPERTTSVEVPFIGGISGTGELTWGQRAIWQELRDVGDTLNISRVQALPAGTTVEAFAELPRQLLSRYPAMRTRLRFDPDGEPIQVVAGSGVFPLGVAEVGDDEDPGQAAHQLAWRSLLTAFRYDTEWPLRVVVTRHRGVLTHAAWTFCHLSVGAGSVPLMFAGLGPDPACQSAPAVPGVAEAAGAPAMNLLELAERERTATVRRQSDIALQYWEKKLRAMPQRAPRVGVPSGEYRGARRWHVRSHSPATYLGLLAVADRTRTDTARVLMALYSVALARVTGVNPVVTRMVVDNRARPGFAGIVGPVSQHGLFAIDVADISIDDAVARARTSTLSAAKYAYYDPADLDALLTRLGRERHPRGEKLRVGTLFNDRGRPARDRPGDPRVSAAVTAQQLAAAVAEFSIVWDAPLDRYTDQLSVAVDNRSATIDLSVSVDTQYLPADALAALLREIQAVAVEAAFDPAAPTRVRRVSDNEGEYT
jgi:hypothetical protein